MKPAKLNEIANPVLSTKTKQSLEHVHDVLCHPNEERTRATAKKLGIEVSGKCSNCEDCAMAKAKQKTIKDGVTKTKPKNESSLKTGEKFGIDISSSKHKSIGGRKYWNLTVCHKTKNKWSHFLKQKGDLKREMIKFITNEVRSKNNMKGSIIRCDNAGENKKIQEEAENKSLGIEFEYTAKNTPQQNAIVERSFSTLWGMIRATMRRCGLNKNKRLKNKLWAECANIVTQVINVLVDNPKDKSSHEKFYGVLPNWCKVSKLQAFGQICVVTRKNKIQGKLEDRGAIGMMVGYANQHAAGTYRVYMIRTCRVIETRDVFWLDIYYGQ